MTLFELQAVLSLDTQGFATDATRATEEGKSLSEKLGADAESIKSAFSDAFSVSIGQLMADGFKTALGAAWDFTKGSVEAASNLEEIQHVVDTVFADKAGVFNQWAKKAKDTFGMGELAAKSYASSIASILSPETRGFNSDEIYEMSTALTQLVGDIASFQNMSFDEVFTMIMSGLRGETESIEQLGIDMRIASLASFAGLDKVTDFSKLSDYEQTMYRYQYIMQATTRMQGDFAETEGSYANQMRLFQENIVKLQTTLGTGLLPVMTSILQFMNSLFGSTQDADEVMGGIQSTLTETYAQIDATAISTLNLIDALAEMEKQGVDTAEEEGVWKALLSELTTTMPGINALINTTTGYIDGGTAALRGYAAQWQATQREIAMSAALQEAQNEIFAKAKEVAELEMGLAVASARASRSNELIAGVYEDARQYLGLGEDIDYGHITGDLATAAAEGDAVAQYYAGLLSEYGSLQNTVLNYENELAAARLELSELNAKYTEMEKRVAALTETPETTFFTGPSLLGGNGPVSQDFAAQIAAAVSAAIGNIHITVEGQAVMDGQTVGTIVFPTVARKLQREAMASAFSPTIK